jgi:hypothetical protein
MWSCRGRFDGVEISNYHDERYRSAAMRADRGGARRALAVWLRQQIAIIVSGELPSRSAVRPASSARATAS